MKNLILIRHGRTDHSGVLTEKAENELIEVILNIQKEITINTVIISASERPCLQTAEFLKNKLNITTELVINRQLNDFKKCNLETFYSDCVNQYKNETILLITHIGLYSDFYSFYSRKLSEENNLRKEKIVYTYKYAII